MTNRPTPIRHWSALELPAGCAGFKVGLWPEGAPVGMLRHRDTGEPLVLPVDLTPHEFCARLCYRVGRYYLLPVDARGERVSECGAVVSITDDFAERASRRAILGVLGDIVNEWTGGAFAQRVAELEREELPGLPVLEAWAWSPRRAGEGLPS